MIFLSRWNFWDFLHFTNDSATGFKCSTCLYVKINIFEKVSFKNIVWISFIYLKSFDLFSYIWLLCVSCVYLRVACFSMIILCHFFEGSCMKRSWKDLTLHQRYLHIFSYFYKSYHHQGSGSNPLLNMNLLFHEIIFGWFLVLRKRNAIGVAKCLLFIPLLNSLVFNIFSSIYIVWSLTK